MRRNKALFEMEEDCELYNQMGEALEVESVLFKSADHLAVD
jgi:hypothetical protein